MEQPGEDDNISIITLDPIRDGNKLQEVILTQPEVITTPVPSPPPLPPPMLNSKNPIPLDSAFLKEENKEKMYDSPRYQTTTTVVETTEYMTNDGPAVRIDFPRLDCAYIRTLGGIMKIVCIVLCLLCFLFVMMGPSYYTGVGWATFVSSIGIFVTTSLLTLYIFRVVDSIQQVNWIVGEMVFCFAWTVFFFIAACVLAVAAAQFSRTLPWAIASFFAFGAMCAYGFDCYLKFLSWRNNERATGGASPVVIQQQQRRNYV